MTSFKSPAEKFLKRHLGFKSINEFQRALDKLPSDRFEFLPDQTMVSRFKVNFQGRNILLTQLLYSPFSEERVYAVKAGLRSLLMQIDSDGETLSEARSMISSFSDKSHFFNDATKTLMRADRSNRKTFRQIVDALFNPGKPAHNCVNHRSDLFFYCAMPGDDVCIVDSMLGNFKLDTVMNVFMSGKPKASRFLHLKRSRMIVSEEEKYLVYPKKDALKLHQVLQMAGDAVGYDWAKNIPALLREASNIPLSTPAPSNGKPLF